MTLRAPTYGRAYISHETIEGVGFRVYLDCEHVVYRLHVSPRARIMNCEECVLRAIDAGTYVRRTAPPFINRHTMACDACAATEEIFDVEGGSELFIKLGWTIRNGEHLCPMCEPSCWPPRVS